MKYNVSIIGGGPSAMFVLKSLIGCGSVSAVCIFEKTDHAGSGMPYGRQGALHEHITNVSGNEIPTLVTSVKEWISGLSPECLASYGTRPEHFSDYKVLPRLLFGQYLEDQFELLCNQASAAGIAVQVHLSTEVIDIRDLPDQHAVEVYTKEGCRYRFDRTVICTGHVWPNPHAGLKGFYDAPYPPSKLRFRCNHAVAIRGASLTAVDAVKTIARQHGRFEKDEWDKLRFIRHDDLPAFSMVLHSRHGLLPAVRFHLDDPHFSKKGLLSEEDIQRYRDAHNGFLSLDYLFEKDFKEMFREKHPDFYDRIRALGLEDFVERMMSLREEMDSFSLLKAEYAEAKQSIEQKRSVYWKEALATLSFAMNYPAKYLPAEDMLRLQKTLMPLISVVIAFLPQSSCEEFFALEEAGVLSIKAVGDDSQVVPHPEEGAVYSSGGEQVHYLSFVDATGQRHLPIDAFPFRSLYESGTIVPSRLAFLSEAEGRLQIEAGNKSVSEENGTCWLTVPGIAINDAFQVLDQHNNPNERVYIMAVPYIGGFNPDYSGLDFCEAASAKIAAQLCTIS